MLKTNTSAFSAPGKWVLSTASPGPGLGAKETLVTNTELCLCNLGNSNS